MFSTYDQWKLRSPDDEAAYRLRYDPIKAAEDEDEWLWLDSLENPQPIDEDDLDEIPPPDLGCRSTQFRRVAHGRRRPRIRQRRTVMSASDIRVGDRFLVEVAVALMDLSGLYPKHAQVRAKNVDGSVYFAGVPYGVLLASKRLPSPIKVGDTVVPAAAPTNDGPWSVVAIDGLWAWCRAPRSDSGWLFRLADLTLAEGASS